MAARRVETIRIVKMSKPEYTQKKTWQFWCVWEGGNADTLKIDTKGLKDGQDISYSEYLSRKKKTNNK